ncbi:hypothetical protein FCL47_17845 [Desulfopila sp. IMCC35006]|uniref:hypothetical protein n=1 Tax=Desulfopila sp. IMCC35006 TaxID=2569542 RepID=UPI0010AD2EE8|nr:hypothetical protein [Desulfopila sp. IMCC35006]TKB24693.1 hypothetical protein FCL47_17845 [Desulfopila sp. IMCC35006]
MKMAKLVSLVMTFGMVFFFLQGTTFAANSSMTGGQNDKVLAPMMNDDAPMKMTTKKMETTMDSDMDKEMKSGMKQQQADAMKKHKKEQMNTPVKTGKKMME